MTQSTTILGSNQFVTGVRGAAGPGVVLTGTSVVDGVQNALLYQGPIAPTDPDGVHILTPVFDGQTIEGATFYGPDTPEFNPAIGKGNVRAVGSYLYQESSARNNGLLYEGPIAGGGTWTELNAGGGTVNGQAVFNTILHSTMGDVVVGNYDLVGVPFSGNACLYNLRTKAWTIFDIAPLTSAYGIWQTEPGGSDYVIVGGAQVGHGANKGLIVRYDARKNEFGRPQFYSAFNHPTLVTHFEGITTADGGYHLAAMTAQGIAVFCELPVNADGSFGTPTWTGFEYPNSMLTTGNTIYRRTMMGVFVEDGGDGVQSYAATFK
ncbi:MAG: hypothetical protein JOZ72_00930 [Alphaproteobacteria bacterium]|nr:hypothetical protein [Alphaproteobacteria bacterium]